MNELLKKIYENVIYNEKDTLKIEKNLEVEIQKLLEPYSKNFNTDELDIIFNLMYAIQLLSMQEGFEQGVRYTLHLMIDLLSDL